MKPFPRHSRSSYEEFLAQHSVPAVPEARSWENTNDTSPRTARETSPYQAGDVIWIADEKNGVRFARKALIHSVSSEYMERRCGWIAMFIVSPINSAGTAWCKGYQRAYPGFIERGFELAANGARETSKEWYR